MALPKEPLCPLCAGPVPWSKLSSAPILCPNCGEELIIPIGYQNCVAFGTLGLAALLLYALGVRGVVLLVGTLIGWLPVEIVSMVVINRVVPPRLTPKPRAGLGLDGTDRGE